MNKDDPNYAQFLKDLEYLYNQCTKGDAKPSHILYFDGTEVRFDAIN